MVDYVCIVYVQGMPSIQSDLFLKWICEYTKKYPWRFVYFENTDSYFTFSENRDRCTNALYIQPSISEWRSNASSGGSGIKMHTVRFERQRILPEEGGWFDVFAGIWDSKASFNTRLMAKWESKFKELYESKQLVLFLVSPPGAGKTFEMEEMKASTKGRVIHRIDCSDDELVERALSSLLDEYFPADGAPSLLIADEVRWLTVFARNAHCS